MDKVKLVGLSECLPAGYPKTGGLIIIRDKKSSSKSKSGRYRSKAKVTFWVKNRLFY